MKPRGPALLRCSRCAASWISIGSSCLSRSSCRTCFGVSPSIRPLRSRPWASSAVYSKAPIRLLLVLAGDAQHFFQGRLARHDLAAPVIANAGARGARVALQVLLRGAVMDHGAHVIVDRDQLVDAGAPAIAGARLAARPVQLHRAVLAGRDSAAAVRIRRP